MKVSDIINHLGEEHEKYYHAVAPPIIQTSNFCFTTVRGIREALLNEFEIPVYSRGNNPTVEILRKKLAALENTGDCLVTSSGCAAISMAVMAHVAASDHIVCVDKPYSWTSHLMNVILPRFGIQTTFVSGTSVAEFRRAVRPNTRLIYIESPNSWTMELQDLRAIASLAKKSNILTLADNSHSTPLYQRPAAYGIDLVVHSASKYLAGHSDVVAGVLCGSSEAIRKIFQSEYLNFGGIPSPHDAWLMLRGLRTLPVRLERSSASAQKIVDHLATHPKTEKIFYPFHPSHPQHALAKRQMSSGSGLFSVLLRAASPKEIERFCERLHGFLIAVSWGGYESLVLPALATYDPRREKKPRLPWNLVRFYIGLEDPDGLVASLDEALGKMK
jgi:cystathionine beta-lyase/cystathionine gamma-synthase